MARVLQVSIVSLLLVAVLAACGTVQTEDPVGQEDQTQTPTPIDTPVPPAPTGEAPDAVTSLEEALIGNPFGLEGTVTYQARHTRPGQGATLTVLRDGATLDMDVTMGERP